MTDDLRYYISIGFTRSQIEALRKAMIVRVTLIASGIDRETDLDRVMAKITELALRSMRESTALGIEPTKEE